MAMGRWTCVRCDLTAWSKHFVDPTTCKQCRERPDLAEHRRSERSRLEAAKARIERLLSDLDGGAQ